jgi:hypothetical protein
MSIPPATPAAAVAVASAGTFAFDATFARVSPVVEAAPETDFSASRALRCTVCCALFAVPLPSRRACDWRERLRVDAAGLRTEPELPLADLDFELLREVEPLGELVLRLAELRDFVCAI